MATPNADRLRGIEPWDPSTNDTTSGILDTIKTELDSVAALTESVATNLGSAIKGATADAVAASLDELGKKVRRHSEDIGVIVGARKEALEAGREAQNKNTEIQKELADAQAQYDSVIQKEPYLQAEMRALRMLDAAHAKAENQAITVLTTLRERTAAAIERIPVFGDRGTGSSNGNGPGRGRSGNRRSSDGSDSRRRSGSGSGSGQNGSGAGGSGSGDAGDAGGSGGSASGPIRSATKWSATVPDPSAGSSGSVSPGGDGGLALQRSHFTVHQTGDVFQGAARPSILHSPSVHNPAAAAAAAAATGGAAVAGYKAYQAVRAARAASQSGTEARANGTAARGVGMARGATTAAREASATSTKGAAAKGALARGGASGVARPAAASARSGGIVRGATTAQRAVSQAPARGSGIVKGATTASRASVPNAPQGSSGGYGRTGAGSKAARSGVGALTARGAQTGAGASSSARGGNLGRGNAARGAAASRGNGLAGSVRGSGAARGTGAAAKNAAVQRAGSAGAGGAGAARGNVAGLRASTGGPGVKSAGLPAYGPKNGMFKQGLSPRPAGSVGKGGIVWRSAPDAPPASATARAVAGLAAGRRRDGEEDARQSPQGPSQASDYEQGREVTFLEAGTWQCGDAATWQQGQAAPQHNKGPQHNGAENF